jgi:hypothetical protein
MRHIVIPPDYLLVRSEAEHMIVCETMTVATRLLRRGNDVALKRAEIDNSGDFVEFLLAFR